MTSLMSEDHEDFVSKCRVQDESSPAFDRSYSLAETADILGVSVPTAWRLLQANKIAYQNVSERRITIRESAIREYLDLVTVAAVQETDT